MWRLEISLFFATGVVSLLADSGAIANSPRPEDDFHFPPPEHMLELYEKFSKTGSGSSGDTVRSILPLTRKGAEVFQIAAGARHHRARGSVVNPCYFYSVGAEGPKCRSEPDSVPCRMEPIGTLGNSKDEIGVDPRGARSPDRHDEVDEGKKLQRKERSPRLREKLPKKNPDEKRSETMPPPSKGSRRFGLRHRRAEGIRIVHLRHDCGLVRSGGKETLAFAREDHEVVRPICRTLRRPVPEPYLGGVTFISHVWHPIRAHAAGRMLERSIVVKTTWHECNVFRLPVGYEKVVIPVGSRHDFPASGTGLLRGTALPPFFVLPSFSPCI
ncbi:unnamed protein product [Darwinula stevensoni]|uniref:Uncharacterized protein n=1 Tax=Darwinula stevensoni TaxID=69355 RepID=A0A7R8XA47_9CRUS|nr:unnamed protein product [Darwinula stevensoni]CAG0891641.1 unnamed protein product [Darwinula stevensoni]